VRRRDFLALAGAATAAATIPGVAFSQAKMPRIVLLSVDLPPHVATAFQDGLRDFGWVDGRTLTVQLVTAPTYADLDALVPEAVATNPDLILTWGITALAYARQQTSSIPIVLGGSAGDPLGSALIASWAHPGDNVTGTTLVAPDLLEQQMAILQHMTPSRRRVAMLNVPAIAVTQAKIDLAAAIAKSLGLDVVMVDFADGEDLAPQFARLVATAPDAVYVPASSYFDLHRDELYDLLVKNSLAALSTSNEPGLPTPFAGVLSYGANADSVVRKAAYYVDAILKGARPSDLPIEFEQPTVYELGANTWAAKKMGFTIPPDLLAHAKVVIDYDIRSPKGPAQ
jgi:putative ABC transport system substrate-binding protein